MVAIVITEVVVLNTTKALVGEGNSLNLGHMGGAYDIYKKKEIPEI